MDVRSVNGQNYRRKRYICPLVCILLIIAFQAVGFASAGESASKDRTDPKTVALWLFDEPNRPYVVLTDSGPNQYHLHLHEAGRLAPGKFGKALEILPEPAYAVGYASITAGGDSDPSNESMQDNRPSPRQLWGPTVAAEEIVAVLTKGNWTCELWLRLSGKPEAGVILIDLGRSYLPGFTIELAAGAKLLTVVNAYGSYRAECPTDAAKLADGTWHHLAFTQSAATGSLRHYLDGRAQWYSKLGPVPPEAQSQEPVDDSADAERIIDERWFREHRFNLSLGHDRKGERHMRGMIDELRFSKTCRYLTNFSVPGSFAGQSDPNVP